MTCYFRHLKQTFTELGVEVTPDNKRVIDKKIHELLGIEYKNCSATWKEIKKRIAEDESGFMTSLDGTLGKLW
ncbi:MAG: hypothetical protein E3J86_04010 [Candidatus Thorarchaeota archaeon]|nr:MAG: hypothetical protein E3J86_04010 [Candidatus Thorarchaeota archaeon]